LAILIPAGLNAIASGELLPPAGVVEVMGNPVDGWTLESFAGQAFPQNPGLLTELFVDLRNVVLAPQTAAWNIFESIFTGPGAPTITSIGDSLLTNTENVGEALLNLPGSVITDIGTEVQNLFGDVAGGEAFTTAFDATILGLVLAISFLEAFAIFHFRAALDAHTDGHRQPKTKGNASNALTSLAGGTDHPHDGWRCPGYQRCDCDCRSRR
jgi:hypothetical protein